MWGVDRFPRAAGSERGSALLPARIPSGRYFPTCHDSYYASNL